MPATKALPKRAHAHARRSHAKKTFAAALNQFWDRRGVKPVAWSLAVLVWLPFLFVLLVVLGINPIFTMGVKKLGSDALKVPVGLRRASVSFAGKLRLGNFEIHNPPGYEGKDAVTFDGMYAEVPMRSVLSQVIRIPVLTVVHPIFNIELGDKHKKSNWAVLMKNLADSLPKKDEPLPPDQEKRFVIGELKIVDPVIYFRSPSLPNGIKLDMKDVELKKIGNAPDSSSKTYIVLASILQAVLTGGIKDKSLPGDVTGGLKDELSAASKDFHEFFGGIK